MVLTTREVGRSWATPGYRRSILAAPSRVALPNSTRIFARFRNQLAPKPAKHVECHKGRIPIPTRGSTKATTSTYGEWGIRIKGNGTHLINKQLMAAEDAIRKELKVIRAFTVYLSIFLDIPVCVKGYETHKGKR